MLSASRNKYTVSSSVHLSCVIFYGFGNNIRDFLIAGDGDSPV